MNPPEERRSVTTHRVSVRGLVEFTLHGEDILPGASVLRAMEEGTAAHKGRQGSLGADWQCEVPLELTVPMDDEEHELLVCGRMDAFQGGLIPHVEEIKLCPGRDAPEEARPAHMAQAVCYGHILCKTRELERVTVSVVYVSHEGKIKRSFDRSLTAVECREAFDALLFPYLRRLTLVLRHMRARDASLRALPFPFPAYRAGQREMAVQVYTAVRLKKRLFAQMPTGTGKSAATLFPALKAMGMGLTGRICYLTARTTQRQGPHEALRRMRAFPMELWVLTLDAKDKLCPHRTLCHPDFCPRAKGHFLRDNEAVTEMLSLGNWTPEVIRQKAEEHCLCPFEFSLALAGLADVTLCDYNYALDPAVHIQRIFDRSGDITLLIDEAHNLIPRVREMLSGRISAADLRQLRRALPGKHPLRRAMTRMMNALEDLPVDESASEGLVPELPQSVTLAVQKLRDAFLDAQGEPIRWEETGISAGDTLSGLLGLDRALRDGRRESLWIFEGRHDRTLTAFAPDVSRYFAEATRRMCGVVCFSATFSPLEDMKRLLGGDKDDACFAVPSPFPPEHLRIFQRNVDTRYQNRAVSLHEVAAAIEDFYLAGRDRCIVYFPSFAYLQQVSELLTVPHRDQRQGMTDEEREAFLAPYVHEDGPVLSLCVLGGVFSEGIDLPGAKLQSVVIVGLGLPQINIFTQTLRRWDDEHLGSGFRYAYQIPGMQKVTQAVGRLIRTGTDTGTALLLDDRYRLNEYRSLLPDFWRIEWEE